VSGVVTVTVLPGPCHVSVRRSSTDCATRTVTYTAANPFAVPARIIESGANGPSGVRTFVVPAHTTKVIFQFSADPTNPSTERFTFALADPRTTLFTDSVAFPCPAPADSGPQLAVTGTAFGRAGWGAGAIAGGLLLTWLGRRRGPHRDAV